MGTFALFLRMLLALGVTLGLLAIVARLARRFQAGGRRVTASGRSRRLGVRPGPEVEVLSRRPVTKTSSIAVVRVGTRTLVLGATSQNVNLITELDVTELGGTDLDESRLDKTPPPTITNGALPWTGGSGATLPSAWDAAIAHLRERTVRR